MTACLLSLLIAAPAPDPVRQVAGWQHLLALTESGRVYGWGRCGNGQLGKVSLGSVSISSPMEIKLGDRAVSMAATPDTSVFVMENGTVAVLGSGYDGAFASGSEARFTRFDEHGFGTQTAIIVPGLKDVVQAAAAFHTYAALRKDGTVAVWGTNSYGLLGPSCTGDGSFVSDTILELKGLPKIKAITSCGSAFGALDAEGHVWTWGSNSGGLLGAGLADDNSHPEPHSVPVPGKVISLALGAAAGFAAAADGSVWKWGKNAWGMLAEGSKEDKVLRKPVKMNLSGARKVVSGSLGRHVLVLKADGSVVSWGNSDWGQCGSGISGQSQYEMKKLGLSGVKDVWAAGNNSFFWTGNQLYWCGPAVTSNGKNMRVPTPLSLDHN